MSSRMAISYLGSLARQNFCLHEWVYEAQRQKMEEDRTECGTPSPSCSAPSKGMVSKSRRTLVSVPE